MGARRSRLGSPLTYQLVDLADIGLPMLDEPLMAALHSYAHPHKGLEPTRRQLRRFRIRLPPIQLGLPGGAEECSGLLYDEWTDKPATMVSHGTRGGNRGMAQLAAVLRGLDMRQLDDHLEVKITHDDVDADWELKDLGALMAPYDQQVRVIDDQMAEALTLPA